MQPLGAYINKGCLDFSHSIFFVECVSESENVVLRNLLTSPNSKDAPIMASCYMYKTP